MYQIILMIDKSNAINYTRLNYFNVCLHSELA